MRAVFEETLPAGNDRSGQITLSGHDQYSDSERLSPSGEGYSDQAYYCFIPGREAPMLKTTALAAFIGVKIR